MFTDRIPIVNEAMKKVTRKYDPKTDAENECVICMTTFADHPEKELA